VFLIFTVTPGIGALSSLAVTTPVTVVVCAAAEKQMVHNTIKMNVVRRKNKLVNFCIVNWFIWFKVKFRYSGLFKDKIIVLVTLLNLEISRYTIVIGLVNVTEM
jgi:hypothetical protein